MLCHDIRDLDHTQIVVARKEISLTKRTLRILYEGLKGKPVQERAIPDRVAEAAAATGGVIDTFNSTLRRQRDEKK
jgi:hypothetical protein